MYKCAPLSTRNQFANLLNSLGLTGSAAEIGVHRGEYARVFLKDWKGKQFFSVDPWSDFPGYEEQAKLLEHGNGDRDDDFRSARKLLKDDRRVQLKRMTSFEARGEFDSCTLDFVYVDGDHRYAHVFADLEGWWDKIKAGGILAGHDWIQPGEDHNWANEVQRAVQDFSSTRRLDVELVVEENGLPWSYYMRKQS